LEVLNNTNWRNIENLTFLNLKRDFRNERVNIIFKLIFKNL